MHLLKLQCSYEKLTESHTSSLRICLLINSKNILGVLYLTWIIDHLTVEPNQVTRTLPISSQILVTKPTNFNTSKPKCSIRLWKLTPSCPYFQTSQVQIQSCTSCPELYKSVLQVSAGSVCFCWLGLLRGGGSQFSTFSDEYIWYGHKRKVRSDALNHESSTS
jgi:hypothetical protein